MDMVNIKINGMPYSVPKGATILEAAREAGVYIPTLCYMRETNEIGACRVCVVELKGARSLVASCVYPVNEGMEVITNSAKVLKARKLTTQLILSTHNKDCLSCSRSGKCELQKLSIDLGVEDSSKYDGANESYDLDNTSAALVRDNSKCILCRRCSAACANVQDIGVIGPNDRGFKTHIGCAFESDLAETSCVSCGQCIVNCPTGALEERNDTDKVFEALNDPSKHVFVQTAPAVRAALGEGFGFPVGTNVEGKMVAALRRLGFEKVFDTNIAADLTIMEEAHEFLDRVQNGGKLPLITSCSPGWVKYCEHYFPDLLDNMSSCKSPQQMFGAVLKTWYAKKNGLDPKDIVSVSVMPCTAKKFEIGRDNQSAAGVADVDIAITTRELAKMINKTGIMFDTLPDEKFDNPLGESTGAAVIFGVTGGVMEAALRTAVETLTGEELKNVNFEAVRGFEGIKKATLNVAGMDIKVAVASGLKNAHELLAKVRSGEEEFHFIEIMACPGGCINGGGQPHLHADTRNFVDFRAQRASALYYSDERNALRKSHESPVVKELYADYFGEPGSHKAHETLHTTYVPRGL